MCGERDIESVCVWRERYRVCVCVERERYIESVCVWRERYRESVCVERDI